MCPVKANLSERTLQNVVFHQIQRWQPEHAATMPGPELAMDDSVRVLLGVPRGMDNLFHDAKGDLEPEA